MRPINRIIVHHSASPREATTRHMIEEWHRANGWKGIGYHWVIEGDGLRYATRSMEIAGAHARGANHDSIGICTVGNNCEPDERWTPQQEDTLRALIGELLSRFGPLDIIGHRDVPGAKTLCPGIDVRNWWNVDSSKP